ncbi:hypothetical protein I79_009028 [Cricetulus griseus]|uniref:Uncharacterized protein n=1 Tax=Cricetulus griseus TaxID=10029 RepID=G3HEP0_CRIGR|nr:hypothetical protein I79_009028 [Cricetulus griseus]
MEEAKGWNPSATVLLGGEDLDPKVDESRGPPVPAAPGVLRVDPGRSVSGLARHARLSP